MTLSERIERAFEHREMPDSVVDMTNRFQIDSDVEEALWFTGRDWHSITWDDWQKHPVATTFFSKEALGYYLPRVLVLSLQRPQEALNPAESLIRELCLALRTGCASTCESRHGSWSRLPGRCFSLPMPTWPICCWRVPQRESGSSLSA